MITQLETVAISLTQNEEDIAVTKKAAIGKEIIAMILPTVLNGKFQLVLLFGDKKWQTRRSMHAFLFN